MFSEKLKQALIEHKMNATALSAATGIGKSSISQYLSGKNLPTEAKQKAIERALNLPYDYFYESGAKKPLCNVPVEVVARLMGKSKKFIYRGLQDGVFPFGYAVKVKDSWSYYISPVKFEEFTGIKLSEVAA